MLPRSLLLLQGFVALFSLAHAACECGYRLKDTGAVYTHKLVSDFSMKPDTSSIQSTRDALLTSDPKKGWTVQSWGVDGTYNVSKPGDAEYRLPRVNMEDNVWVQGGTLHLRQKGYSEDERERRDPVRVAEVVNNLRDILYGSFRAQYRVLVQRGTEGGGVAGFFHYHSDVAETDIEIITSDGPNYIHYTRHIPSNNTDPASDTIKTTLRKPISEYQEHRWDITPTAATFFQDGRVVHKIPGEYRQKGHIILNLWADDGAWSGRASNKDIEMQVRYISLFYNSTSSHVGQDREYNSQCNAARRRGARDAVCEIEDCCVPERKRGLPKWRDYCGGIPIKHGKPGGFWFRCLSPMCFLNKVWRWS